MSEQTEDPRWAQLGVAAKRVLLSWWLGRAI